MADHSQTDKPGRRTWRYNPYEIRVDSHEEAGIQHRRLGHRDIASCCIGEHTGDDESEGTPVGGGTMGPVFRMFTAANPGTEPRYDWPVALDFDVVIINTSPDMEADYFEVEPGPLSPAVQALLDRPAAPLYGLLLTGGESRRMGRDKALIEVAGQTPIQRAGELLSAVCDEVYISARAGQRDEATLPYPVIADQFLGIGPAGGILSAQRAHPHAAWLVMACDLPYAGADTLAALIAGRDPKRYATAFISSSDGFPEPLCAIWEPKSHARLLHFLALGYSCPRKVLINSRTQLLPQANPHWLDNINTPTDLHTAQSDLG